MIENLAEYYYEKLKSSDNVGRLLTEFFSHLFGIESTLKTVIMMNKLIKLYGRFTVYFSILDVYKMDKVDPTNAYGILFFFCKKRIEEKYDVVLQANYNNLDKFADGMEKKIEKMIEKQKRKHE